MTSSSQEQTTSPKKMGTESRALLGSTIIIFLGAVLNGLSMILARILLGRTLGPGGFGTVSTMWAFGTTLGVLPVAGIAPGVTRFLSLYVNQGKLGLARGLAIVTSIWTGVLAALLTFASFFLSPVLATHWLHDPSVTSWLRLATIGIPAWAVLHWSVAVFRGLSQTLPTFLFRDTLRPALLILLLIPGWYMGTLGITCGIMVNIISSLIAAVVALFVAGPMILRKTRGALRETEVGPWFRFAWPLTLSMLLQQVAGRSIDVLALAFLSTPAQVGIFSSANALVAITGLLIQGVNYLALPMLMTGRTGVNLNSFQQARTLMFHFGLPLFLTFILWPKEIAIFTFGKEFAESSRLIPILAAGVFFSAFVGPLGQLLMAEGRARWHLLADIISIAFFLFLMGGLAPIYGATGAAVARTSSLILFEILALFRLVRFNRVQIFDSIIFQGVTRLVTPLLVARFLLWGGGILFPSISSPLISCLVLGCVLFIVYFPLLRRHGIKIPLITKRCFHNAQGK